MGDAIPVDNVKADVARGDFPNYDAERQECEDFLRNFRLPSLQEGGEGEAKYVDMVQAVIKRETIRFDVDLNDVLLAKPALVEAIVGNTRRYLELFSRAVDSMLPEPDANVVTDDVQDVLLRHRVGTVKRQVAEDAAGGLGDAGAAAAAGGVGVAPVGGAAKDVRTMFPRSLLRRFEVRFTPLARSLEDAEEPSGKRRSGRSDKTLRDVKAADLGRLVTVTCIVIRAFDIKPMVEIASYTCDTCGCELFQEVTAKVFMPLFRCTSAACKTNGVIGKVHMQTRGSKYTKYQELRIQELPEQVPIGDIPRTMVVVARGEATRQVKPGDIIEITGIFMPTPSTGARMRGRSGLTADTFLEAQHMLKLKKAAEELIDPGLEAAVEELSDNKPYERLARSLAPEIFGMEDVKKALLLQLVGGVQTTESDGMKLRADINICLMGDPGVAKSQLLKHVAKVAPRAVYTTGKGSSGVGLTAAVVRDPVTQELSLEGGALVLADMGICCIDEFDKMDESDRTAIHEVMEQQTVSIAKAGITTTLNARTAILAAANPRYGRYNRRLDADAHASLMKNINLPAALLSRFDLMFLLLDDVDADADRALADHVTYVHQRETHPPLDFAPLPSKFIRQYISVAKHIRPEVPPSLAPHIVEAYVDMRERDRQRAGATGSRGTLTARQLLSILRMAQALARLEMRLEVSEADVDEAIRLITVSKASVLEKDEREGADADATSRIYGLLRDRVVALRQASLPMADAQALVTQANFSSEQLAAMLREYGDLGLIQQNATRTLLTFVHSI